MTLRTDEFQERISAFQSGRNSTGVAINRAQKLRETLSTEVERFLQSNKVTELEPTVTTRDSHFNGRKVGRIS